MAQSLPINDPSAQMGDQSQRSHPLCSGIECQVISDNVILFLLSWRGCSLELGQMQSGC